MSICIFASLRNQYSPSDISVSVTSGGNTTQSHSLGLRVFGVSRGGKNINSDRIPVSVVAGQKVIITLNSSLRANGEDIYRIGIAGETTGNDEDSYILAEFEAKQADQLTNITLTQIILDYDAHFTLSGSVPTFSNLPTQTINGMGRYVTDEDKYYLRRGGEWVEVSGLSTYVSSTQQVKGAGMLYGGCDVPVLSLAEGDYIEPPDYNSSIGGDSYPLKYWLLNGVQEVGGGVIPSGNFLALRVYLNGSVDQASALSDEVTITALSKVRKSDGTAIATDITNDSSIWTYGEDYLFVCPENIPQGYALGFSITFNSSELVEGDTVAFVLYDRGNYGIPESSLGFLGSAIFPYSPYCRIVPSLNGVRRLQGQGIVLNEVSNISHRFTSNGPEDVLSGVLADTANQKVVISGVMGGQINVKQEGTALLNTEAIRAIVSTESGIAPCSSWSNTVSLTSGQELLVTVNYPCSVEGLGTIRANYPDVIAGNDQGYFNPVRLRVEVRKDGTIYQQSNVTVVQGTSQNIVISSLGSAGASPSVNNDADFNLWGYGTISLSAIAGTSSLTSGSYEVRIYYEYPSPNTDLTRISHATNDGCIPELLSDYGEMSSAYFYSGKVSSNDATRGYLSGKLIAGDGIELAVLNDGASEQLEITAVGGLGGGHIVQDNGVGLTQRANLNFTGDGVTVTDDSGNDATVIDISPVAGAAATVDVGTVTTGAAGSSVVVTNSGTTSAAILDFTIPRGDTGSVSATAALELVEQSSDPAAIASKVLVYAKDDHKLYKRIPSGTISEVGGSSTTVGSESLSGDYTLSDNDPSILELDPNGADRSLIIGSRTTPITVVNSSNGTYGIDVKETVGGATSFTLKNTGNKLKAVYIYKSGSNFNVFNLAGY